MEYKLIATDMDGTLLSDNNEITKRNINAIIDIQKKGIKFVLASGRPTFAMVEYAKQLEMDKFGGYILSFNGGQLVDMSNNEIIFHEGHNMDDIRRIYNFSKELDIPMVLYGFDTIYASKDTEGTRFEATICKMKIEIFETIEELEKKGITTTTKCMLIGNKESIKEAEIIMNQRYGNEYFIAISNPLFLEIANKNINKGKTLKKLGEIENIETKDMIACGDAGNDKSMLLEVGMPVAVDNAIDEIKKISKYISTSNNNDALEDVINKFF